MDHLEVRFGREVIFAKEELQEGRLIVKPQPVDMEQILPVSARPREQSGEVRSWGTEEFADKEVQNQYARI